MKSFLLVLLGVVIGAGIVGVFGWSQYEEEIFLPQQEGNAAVALGAIGYNCALSGGTMKDGACSCPLDLPDQTQEQMYDAATGFCQSTMGGPAGNAFFASVGLPYGEYDFYRQIVMNACTESGGSMSGAACRCPSGNAYNTTTGQCQ